MPYPPISGSHNLKLLKQTKLLPEAKKRSRLKPHFLTSFVGRE